MVFDAVNFMTSMFDMFIHYWVKLRLVYRFYPITAELWGFLSD
jgi:hypothetical protein